MGARDIQSIPTPLVIAGTLDEFPPDPTTYVSKVRAWTENHQVTLTALDAVCTHISSRMHQQKK